jgi:type IV pilus assembly protein PilV
MTRDIQSTKQRGSLLLEGLIGILLFSVGILAVVALQGTATKAVTQAKFRSDASFLADQLIGQVWANRTNAAAYAYCGTGATPAVLNAWVTQVNARLPNSATYQPCVQVTPTVYAGPPAYTAYQVNVTLFWQMPDEYNSSPRPPAHGLTFSTLIPCC